MDKKKPLEGEFNKIFIKYFKIDFIPNLLLLYYYYFKYLNKFNWF